MQREDLVRWAEEEASVIPMMGSVRWKGRELKDPRVGYVANLAKSASFRLWEMPPQKGKTPHVDFCCPREHAHT